MAFLNSSRFLIQAHLGGQACVTFRLVRLLVLRNAALEKIGFGGIQCALDHLVQEQLVSLGWFFFLGRWKHFLFPSGFTMTEICQLEVWKKVQHFLRQTWRAHHWNRLPGSHRHELIGGNIPAFSEERFELVKRFSRVDGMALKLSIGAVQSPYVRSLGCNGLDSHCPFCGAKNVFWEHLWLCGMQQDPPEDTMLQRFGWPVNNDSFKSFPAVSWGGQELCWFLQSPTHQSGECRPLPIMPALGMQATPYNACWESNPLPLMPAWFSFVDWVSVFPPGSCHPKDYHRLGIIEAETLTGFVAVFSGTWLFDGNLRGPAVQCHVPPRK